MSEVVLRSVRAFKLFQLALVVVFLDVFAPYCAITGMSFGAVVVSLLGLLAAAVALQSEVGWLRLLRRLMFAEHGAILLVASFQLLRSAPGDWSRLAGTEGWSDPVLTLASSGELIAITSGQSKNSWFSADGAKFESRRLPGAHGWATLDDPARGRFWVGPSRGRVLNYYDRMTQKWMELEKPGDYVWGLALQEDRTYLCLDDGLFVARLDEAWTNTGALLRCKGVAADGERIVATGDRWIESKDRGASWVDIGVPGAPHVATPYVIPGHRFVLAAHAAMLERARLYGGKDGDPLRPIDLPVRDARSLAVDPADPKRMFVSSWGEGVFRSCDGGETWIDLGLQGVEVDPVVVDFHRHRAYAGARNLILKGGIYRFDFPASCSGN